MPHAHPTLRTPDVENAVRISEYIGAMRFMSKGPALRGFGALTGGLAAVCALGGCVQPRVPLPTPGQSVSWLLRVGPQRGNPPIVCASDRPPPCVSMRGMGEQRIEATLVIFLPRTSNHTFTGEVLVGFIGADIGPAAHALRVDQNTTPEAGSEAALIGLVTFKPGTYPIQIRLEETGADLTTPRRHAIDLMVEVR